MIVSLSCLFVVTNTWRQCRTRDGTGKIVYLIPRWLSVDGRKYPVWLNRNTYLLLRPFVLMSNRFNCVVFRWCRVRNSLHYKHMWSKLVWIELKVYFSYRFIMSVKCITLIGSMWVFVPLRKGFSLKGNSTQYRGETIRYWIYNSTFHSVMFV